MAPSYHRRDVLRLGGSAAGVVLAGVTAGCGSLDRSPPAGSLVFDDRLSVPEVVTVRITSGPVEVDDPMYLAGANVALDPGERRTVRSVFEKPGTYTVES